MAPPLLAQEGIRRMGLIARSQKRVCCVHPGIGRSQEGVGPVELRDGLPDQAVRGVGFSNPRTEQRIRCVAGGYSRTQQRVGGMGFSFRCSQKRVDEMYSNRTGCRLQERVSSVRSSICSPQESICRMGLGNGRPEKAVDRVTLAD